MINHGSLQTRRIYNNVSFKVDLLNAVQENISDDNRLSMDLTHYIRQSVPKTFHRQTAPDAFTGREEIPNEINSCTIHNIKHFIRST